MVSRNRRRGVDLKLGGKMEEQTDNERDEQRERERKARMRGS